MEAERATEIFSQLNNTCAVLCVVRSAQLQGSIVYENTPMKVPVTDVCDLKLDVLTGEQPCCERQLLTLRKQLLNVTESRGNNVSGGEPFLQERV